MSSQLFTLLVRQLVYEVAETYSAMMDIKLGLVKSDPANNATPQNLKKVNSIIGKKHALKIYDQFALNTSCFLGKYHITFRAFYYSWIFVPKILPYKVWSEKKYNQFALNTSCFLGKCRIKYYCRVVQFHEIFVTKIMNKLFFYYCWSNSAVIFFGNNKNFVKSEFKNS